MADPALPPDPYESTPSFWQRRPDCVWAAAVFVLTAVLTVTAFPPFHAGEFGYVLAVPAIFWAYGKPRLKLYAWTLFGAQAVAWTILLGWLHNVSWLGLALLGPFVGAWVGLWYLAVWWTMPRILDRPMPVRLAAQLGLAGLWVLIEWSRTWVLGGFPWLPLAASQWQQISILQIASYTGAWGVSFVLIAMNVGFAAFLHRMLLEGKTGFGRRSQEFGLALFLLMACLCVFLIEVQPLAPHDFRPLARVAFVQPDIPESVKWDPADAPRIVRTLENLTLETSLTQPDLILWPESVLPWAVKGDPQSRAFAESLAARARAPLLFGSNAVEDAGTDRVRWFDAAFVASPDSGLQTAYYAKRQLVPFGEYVPLRPLLGWLSKIVPIGSGDFARGTDAAPLVIALRHEVVACGALICYEDIYPRLAREEVLAGSDALVVLTNTAWFGEGGAAYQHAAHSVLRAVETRRPVLRCGNAGWSGWIDEFGGIRYTLADDNGSVYFRGTGVIDVTRSARWAGRNSFYVEHGDWFIPLCATLAALGYAAAGLGRPRSEKS